MLIKLQLVFFRLLFSMNVQKIDEFQMVANVNKNHVPFQIKGRRIV